MKLNYIPQKITNLINVTKIVTIHYFEFDKSYSYAGESHNFWEMVYVDAGNVKIKADCKEFHLKQGEVIFHKPNEFHTIEADMDSAANVFVISFISSSAAMRFFKGKTMPVPSKLKKHILTIIEEYTQGFNYMATDDTKLELKENPPLGCQQMIKTYLEQLLILLIRSESGNRDMRIFPSKESVENHLVFQIIQTISESSYKKINVNDICLKLNYSRTYLSKIFKKASGYTISEYILMEKIREAKKLIREEKYNFTQISDLLAFDNPHYFSAVFKRQTNMTPTSYKRSVKKP